MEKTRARGDCRVIWAPLAYTQEFSRQSYLIPWFLALCLAIIAPRAAPAASEPTIKILALGDSLVAGLGLPRADAFPAQLERALRDEGISATVINGGVSGDTSYAGRKRLSWAMADKPQAVIVALGANDMLRALPPEKTEENLDAILTALKGSGVKILLAGMRAAPNLGKQYVSAFDGLYPRLAKKHGVALYPFFLAGVALKPEFNQGDGKHPNAKGVAVMVRGILPSLRQVLPPPGKKR